MNFKEEIENLSDDSAVKFLDVITCDHINHIKNMFMSEELREIFEKALCEAEVVVDRWAEEGGEDAE